MSLKEYIRKRDFQKTTEPAAKRVTRSGRRFIIQKHDASRLHYDFRLEMDGTLKSWALPKGMPYEHAEKRLAVEVEDHPVAYADFEGVIPQGEYGGGTVMVWDRGSYEPLTRQPLQDLKNGKLHFTLHGDKLNGEWYLVRLRSDDQQWLIIRGGKTHPRVSKKQEDTSVASGKSMKQLSVGDRVWRSKNPSVKKRSPQPASLPAFVEPMKAKLIEEPPTGDWVYEIKFDGWRAIGLKGGRETRLVSRNEKDLGVKFPDILEDLGKLKARDAIFDGEIVALDDAGRSSFQHLQAYDIGEEKPPLFYYVFDLLQLNGKDLRRLPLAERRVLLEKVLKTAPASIRYSDSLGSSAQPLLKQAAKLGLEGLIGKRVASVYEAGRRSGEWVKLKLLQEQEFVIGGYTNPEGSRSHFGAMLVGYYDKGDLICCGKVGTGFSTKLLSSLHRQFQKIERKSCPFSNLPVATRGKWGQGITQREMTLCHWLSPSLIAQIKFGEWTRDGRLRQPVFLGLRKDKNAKDVAREKIG